MPYKQAQDYISEEWVIITPHNQESYFLQQTCFLSSIDENAIIADKSRIETEESKQRALIQSNFQLANTSILLTHRYLDTQYYLEKKEQSERYFLYKYYKKARLGTKLLDEGELADLDTENTDNEEISLTTLLDQYDAIFINTETRKLLQEYNRVLEKLLQDYNTLLFTLELNFFLKEFSALALEHQSKKSTKTKPKSNT